MVIASLTFLKPLPLYDTEKPYFLVMPGSVDSSAFRKTNLEYSTKEGVTIEDVRDRGLSSFDLEEDGFQFLNYEPKTLLGKDNENIETYCREITELVSREYNAAHAVCYDYRLRRSDLGVGAYEENQDTGRAVAAPPVFPVHIDHTVEGGPRRIQRHLTDQEIEMYMKGGYRARIINVWRPIDNTVEDCPIAICDPRHIDTQDLVATDRVSPDFAVEMYYVKFNTNQKWYWLRKQTTSELTVFVNYDSQCRTDDSGNWKTCPHAAFTNPEALSDAPVRSSVEVRVIIFTQTLGAGSEQTKE